MFNGSVRGEIIGLFNEMQAPVGFSSSDPNRNPTLFTGRTRRPTLNQEEGSVAVDQPEPEVTKRGKAPKATSLWDPKNPWVARRSDDGMGNRW